MPVKVRIAEKLFVNSIANTFKFDVTEARQVKYFKHWYSDVSMIGRHYLLYSED